MEIDDYVSKLAEETKCYNEIEKLRYVYIDLGKRMSFDLNFSFGNMKNKLKIYRNCNNDKVKLNDYFTNKKIICKSLSYLLQYVLEQLNIKSKIVIQSEDIRVYNHVYNVVYLKDSKKIQIDLQSDLENIQVNSKTQYFGFETDLILSEHDLEKLDKKIGYISEKVKYTDDYFLILKEKTDKIDSLSLKIEYILNNINIYSNLGNMGYVEKRNHCYNLISKVISKKENNKIHFIDGYIDIGVKHYILCIVVENIESENTIFICHEKAKVFNKITLEQIAYYIKNGLVIYENIPGLRKYINNQEKVKVLLNK